MTSWRVCICCNAHIKQCLLRKVGRVFSSENRAMYEMGLQPQFSTATGALTCYVPDIKQEPIHVCCSENQMPMFTSCCHGTLIHLHRTSQMCCIIPQRLSLNCRGSSAPVAACLQAQTQLATLLCLCQIYTPQLDKQYPSPAHEPDTRAIHHLRHKELHRTQ